MRGRLFLGGVTGETPVSDALDVLTVVLMDTPGDALKKWRTGLDRAVAAARARGAVVSGGKPDRASWGLAPGQVEAQRRFMNRMGG